MSGAQSILYKVLVHFSSIYVQSFRSAPAGAKGPEGSERAFIQAREYDLHLESKLGKRRLVTETTPQAQVGGYWCEVCECTLRDSAGYLDHINGKNHQKKLGYSMRVERSTVDQVKARFDKLKAQKAAASSGSSGRATLDADDRYALAAMDAPSIHVVSADKVSRPSSSSSSSAVGSSSGSSSAAAAASSSSSASSAAAAPSGSDAPAAKRGRWDNPQSNPSSSSATDASSSAASSSSSANTSGAAAAEEEAEGMDPEMAAMMGFSGFGGSKKGR